jgi:cyclopropane fatty-acyl-phospholipid synthase-like methyltransferase
MVDEKYLTGTAYEDWYSDPNSEYFGLYVQNGIANQARELNQYIVDLAIMTFGLDAGSKVLEAGCGVGHAMKPWLDRGFDCYGIEISRSAKRWSRYRNRIVVGNINDMPMFKDDEFDLVFSQGTMEHIEESRVLETASELSRVGIRQFHAISIDPISPQKDPGHITIAEPKWWMQQFGESGNLLTIAGIIPDVLVQENRGTIVFAAPVAVMKYPLRVFVKNTKIAMDALAESRKK